MSAVSGGEARAGGGEARPGSRSGSEARAGSGAARIGSGAGGAGGIGGRVGPTGRVGLGCREGVARGVAGEELPVEGVQLTGTVAAVAGPAHHHLGEDRKSVV